MISVAITTFNRVGLVLESFSKILNNDLVNEVIIIDDYSDRENYDKLFQLIRDIRKVKFLRNEINLGLLLNKRKAISKCTNGWVIILDSDNVIDNNYIEVVNGIFKEDNLIYIPEILCSIDGNEFLNFKEFRNVIIDKNNIKNYIDNKKFLMLLNNGNFLVNRNMYLSVSDNINIFYKCFAADAIYFCYLWLLNGNRIRTIPELKYIHRVHSGSFWNQNEKKSNKFLNNLVKKIKKW